MVGTNADLTRRGFELWNERRFDDDGRLDFVENHPDLDQALEAFERCCAADAVVPARPDQS